MAKIIIIIAARSSKKSRVSWQTVSTTKIWGFSWNEDCTKGKWIGQPEKLLERYGMDQAKVIATPVDTNLGISTDEVDQQKYQSAVGSLLYLPWLLGQTSCMQSTILQCSLPIQMWNTGQQWSELWDICEEQPILVLSQYVQKKVWTNVSDTLTRIGEET